jgi:hypothetical protein
VRVSFFSTLRVSSWWLGLLVLLAACQAQPETQTTLVSPTHPPTGHFTGSLEVPGQPALRAALEIRHPRPGHYNAELLVGTEPSLSFVADTLDFKQNTLHLQRPGRPGETLTIQQQGDFWRGMLTVDSVDYPTLLLRRGPAEPTVYRVRRDEVAGPSGTALLFSPADETMLGGALALFPTPLSATNAPSWADALARQGYTVLLLPAADTLPAQALKAALTYLRRTPGVDTARVGAWAAGSRATQLATLLTQPDVPTPQPAFIVAQEAPAPDAASRRTWRTLGQGGRVLGVYEATDAATVSAANGLRVALGGRRAQVVRGQGKTLITNVVDWLREL